MRLAFALTLFIVSQSAVLSAQENWLSARTAFVVNKSVIIDNPDNFFFDAEIETSSLICSLMLFKTVHNLKI
jgi:hypothetical protein